MPYQTNEGGSIEGYLYIQTNTTEEVLGMLGIRTYPEGLPKLNSKRIAAGNEKCPIYLTVISMHGLHPQILKVKGKYTRLKIHFKEI